MVIERMQLWL